MVAFIKHFIFMQQIMDYYKATTGNLVTNYELLPKNEEKTTKTLKNVN